LTREDKPSILVVDDDENISATLATILRQKGYKTETAKNGQEAMRKTRAKYFNIALLDIRLPDMEGTKLLTALHRDVPKTVKIMITGYPSIENAVQALNQGADAYIIKPVKPEKLLTLIKDKLQEQSQAQQMTEEKITDWIKTRARKIESETRKESNS